MQASGEAAAVRGQEGSRAGAGSAWGLSPPAVAQAMRHPLGDPAGQAGAALRAPASRSRSKDPGHSLGHHGAFHFISCDSFTSFDDGKTGRSQIQWLPEREMSSPPDVRRDSSGELEGVEV